MVVAVPGAGTEEVGTDHRVASLGSSLGSLVLVLFL